MSQRNRYAPKSVQCKIMDDVKFYRQRTSSTTLENRTIGGGPDSSIVSSRKVEPIILKRVAVNLSTCGENISPENSLNHHSHIDNVNTNTDDNLSNKTCCENEKLPSQLNQLTVVLTPVSHLKSVIDDENFSLSLHKDNHNLCISDSNNGYTTPSKRRRTCSQTTNNVQQRYRNTPMTNKEIIGVDESSTEEDDIPIRRLHNRRSNKFKLIEQPFDTDESNESDTEIGTPESENKITVEDDTDNDYIFGEKVENSKMLHKKDLETSAIYKPRMNKITSRSSEVFSITPQRMTRRMRSNISHELNSKCTTPNRLNKSGNLRTRLEDKNFSPYGVKTPTTRKSKIKNLEAKLPICENTPSVNMTPKGKALAALHTTSAPDCLPCRKEEFEYIYNFVHDSIDNMTGGYMYIHGVPGTGKTATVKRVIDRVQKESQIKSKSSMGLMKKLRNFIMIDINGADSRRPKDVYCKLWEKISGEKVSDRKAQIGLKKKFTSSVSKNEKPVFLVIDEFDFLCSKRQTVIHDILDWSSSRKLTVVAIANTHNLLENVKNAAKAKNRENQELRSIGFHPYTFQQLNEIILDRLKDYDIFQPKAVELLARKAASKGDARVALNLCRRVLTIIQENEIQKEKIDIKKVSDILVKVHSTPLHTFIRKNLSELDKLVLRSIRDVLLNTGSVTCTIQSGVYHQYRSLSALDGLAFIQSEMDILWQVQTLIKYGLVQNTSKDLTINSELTLLIEPEDVHLALMVKD